MSLTKRQFHGDNCIFYRCLLHKDVYIAEFLGIYQTPESETPVQLYNGHLLSLRRYVNENRDKCDLNKLLLDSLAGLRYLHTKGLVHMELTMDTVTVCLHLRYILNFNAPSE